MEVVKYKGQLFTKILIESQLNGVDVSHFDGQTVQLICDGHSIFVNKSLLVANSRLLKKLLFDDPSDCPTIFLPDFGIEIVEKFCQLLYQGFTLVSALEIEQVRKLAEVLDFQKPAISDPSIKDLQTSTRLKYYTKSPYCSSDLSTTPSDFYSENHVWKDSVSQGKPREKRRLYTNSSPLNQADEQSEKKRKTDIGHKPQEVNYSTSANSASSSRCENSARTTRSDKRSSPTSRRKLVKRTLRRQRLSSDESGQSGVEDDWSKFITCYFCSTSFEADHDLERHLSQSCGKHLAQHLKFDTRLCDFCKEIPDTLTHWGYLKHLDICYKQFISSKEASSKPSAHSVAIDELVKGLLNPKIVLKRLPKPKANALENEKNDDESDSDSDLEVIKFDKELRIAVTALSEKAIRVVSKERSADSVETSVLSKGKSLLKGSVESQKKKVSVSDRLRSQSPLLRSSETLQRRKSDSAGTVKSASTNYCKPGPASKTRNRNNRKLHHDSGNSSSSIKPLKRIPCDEVENESNNFKPGPASKTGKEELLKSKSPKEKNHSVCSSGKADKKSHESNFACNEKPIKADAERETCTLEETNCIVENVKMEGTEDCESDDLCSLKISNVYSVDVDKDNSNWPNSNISVGVQEIIPPSSVLPSTHPKANSDPGVRDLTITPTDWNMSRNNFPVSASTSSSGCSKSQSYEIATCSTLAASHSNTQQFRQADRNRIQNLIEAIFERPPAEREPFVRSLELSQWIPLIIEAVRRICSQNQRPDLSRIYNVVHLLTETWNKNFLKKINERNLQNDSRNLVLSQNWLPFSNVHFKDVQRHLDIAIQQGLLLEIMKQGEKCYLVSPDQRGWNPHRAQSPSVLQLMAGTTNQRSTEDVAQAPPLSIPPQVGKNQHNTTQIEFTSDSFSNSLMSVSGTYFDGRLAQNIQQPPHRPQSRANGNLGMYGTPSANPSRSIDQGGQDVIIDLGEINKKDEQRNMENVCVECGLSYENPSLLMSHICGI